MLAGRGYSRQRQLLHRSFQLRSAIDGAPPRHNTRLNRPVPTRWKTRVRPLPNARRRRRWTSV